jgi:ribose transport system substrate-binding protein
MVSDVEQSAKQANQQGYNVKLTVVNADNTASDQVSQVLAALQKKPNVLMIDSASETALNGVIARANAEGIKVVAVDNPVTSPYTTNVWNNWHQLGLDRMGLMAKQLHGKGNVILVGGVAGSSVDKLEDSGWTDVIKQYPGIHVAATVYGDWADPTSETAVAQVLPTLPKIAGVVTDGGGYGVAEAFADAHRTEPIIYFGSRGSELKWWAKQLPGYTAESVSSDPSMGQVAFWVGVDEVEGYKFNKMMYMPPLWINNSNIVKYAKETPFDDVAQVPYTNATVLSSFHHTNP